MIRWFAFLVASIAFNTAAILLAPLLPLLASPRLGPADNGNAFLVEPRLPGWLSWFMTPDNSLWGDNGHKERWSNAGSYAQTVAWLWRNPAYGFELDVLGARLRSGDMVYSQGDPWIKNRNGGRAGWLRVSVGGYFCYKRVVDLGNGYCLMAEIGWKLQPFAQRPYSVNDASTAQLVFSIRCTEFSPA